MKHIRKGNHKEDPKPKTITIMKIKKIIHSNMDGYKSKKESVDEIASTEKPDIMTLIDTNLKGKLKVKVPGYFS